MACTTFTEEQLRRAWREHRKPTWPPSFEEAMAHPLYSRLVTAAARAFKPQPPARPAPSRPTWPAPTHTPPALDFKRRAAGERDDD